jgi:hypothetical protein
MKAYPKDLANVVPPQIAAVVVGTLGLLLIEGPMGVHTGIETIGRCEA